MHLNCGCYRLSSRKEHVHLCWRMDLTETGSVVLGLSIEPSSPLSARVVNEPGASHEQVYPTCTVSLANWFLICLFPLSKSISCHDSTVKQLGRSATMVGHSAHFEAHSGIVLLSRGAHYLPTAVGLSVTFEKSLLVAHWSYLSSENLPAIPFNWHPANWSGQLHYLHIQLACQLNVAIAFLHPFFSRKQTCSTKQCFN